MIYGFATYNKRLVKTNRGIRVQAPDYIINIYKETGKTIMIASAITLALFIMQVILTNKLPVETHYGIICSATLLFFASLIGLAIWGTRSVNNAYDREIARLQEIHRDLVAKQKAAEEEELDRKVLVSGRVKSQEEKILYSVDTLHSAITAGNQVRFKYCDWDLQKQMVPRHEGQLYTVSPWVMVWENGNYYMIAYTEGRLKHYRVDKMRKVELLPDTEREGAEEYAEFDVNQYMQQMFDMFNGPVRKVTMRCENRLAGAMIDRFGTGVTLVRNPDGDHFNVVVNVQVSPRFYGWVAGFGTGIEILDPPSVRAEMKKKLDELEGLYR